MKQYMQVFRVVFTQRHNDWRSQVGEKISQSGHEVEWHIAAPSQIECEAFLFYPLIGRADSVSVQPLEDIYAYVDSTCLVDLHHSPKKEMSNSDSELDSCSELDEIRLIGEEFGLDINI